MQKVKPKLQKPASCEGCSLFEKGLGFCPDNLAKKEEYAFFGEAPGSTELVEAKPFVGKAGWVLREWLLKSVPQLKLALDRGQVSFRNVLKCLPPEVQGRPYPKGHDRVTAEKHCSQYMEPIRAHTVILCGEVPQRYFFGEELANEDASDRQLDRELKGVMGRIGRVVEKDGIRWIFAPHPAFILRQPALVQHGQNALKIAANTERVIEPDLVKWNEAIMELTQ